MRIIAVAVGAAFLGACTQQETTAPPQAELAAVLMDEGSASDRPPPPPAAPAAPETYVAPATSPVQPTDKPPEPWFVIAGNLGRCVNAELAGLDSPYVTYIALQRAGHDVELEDGVNRAMVIDHSTGSATIFTRGEFACRLLVARGEALGIF